jgi:hypothetical protein
LEPAIGGSIEVARSEENLLGFGGEELGTTEEVVAALGEVEVKLVPVPTKHVRRGYFCTSGRRERLRGWRRRRPGRKRRG